MKRKSLGVALFCLVLLAAIVAGYWDMLTAEKLRVVRDRASDAVGEIAAIVRPQAETNAPGAAPAGEGASTATPEPAIEGPAPSGNAPAGNAPSDPPPSVQAPSGQASGEPKQPPADEPSGAGTEAATGTDSPSASETAISASPDATESDLQASGSAPSEPSAPASGATDPDDGAPKDAAVLAAPSFDILRVEPDGAVVIAGRAPAGTVVTLRDGSTVIGSQAANADGEFVVVLDEPLPVGDHQIRIEAKAEDGLTVISKETAVVSIPEKGRESELLAIVEAPDQASRLINIPTAPATSDPSTDAQQETVAALPPPATAAEEGPSVTNPEIGASTATPSPDPAAATPADLAVEAVEIEDDTIYVAGRATGGAAVRIYIDNAFLAEDRGLAEGRFLVTAKTAVATGEHMVRADALDPAGTVIARVEVPFFKPEGRAMSAISSAPAAVDAGEGNSEAIASPPAVPAPEVAALSGADAPEASPNDAPSSTGVAAPPVDEPAGGQEDVAAPSGQSLPNDEPSSANAGSSTAEPESPQATTDAGASQAEPTREAAVAGTESGAAAENDGGTRPVGDIAAPTGPDVTPAPPASAPATTTTPGDASTSTVSEPSITVTRQAALEPAASRVIIRRGDTLWRISRETYGLGRRYTVIYLANGDQIRDPNRIYPGQVFRVPDDKKTEAETPTPPG